MSVIAAAVDLRSLFGPVGDQGPRPTCLAFAASDVHAALRSGWVPLSREYAFYQAQRRAGRPPSRGALLSSMLDALRENGQPEEGGWPYLGFEGDCSEAGSIEGRVKPASTGYKLMEFKRKQGSSSPSAYPRSSLID
jgi:hypothetical protein